MGATAWRPFLIILLGIATVLLLAPRAAADYEFSHAFGAQGSGPGEFDLPLGVAVDNDGVIFVADTFNNRVQRFDPAGGFLGEIGGEGAGPGRFNSPFDVDVAPGGNLVVADTGNRRLQVLDPLTGGSLRVIGEPGSGPGQLAAPTGVVAQGADLLTVDRDNARVHRYDASGSLVEAWGTAGAGSGEFLAPLDLAVAGGDVFVADAGNDRVQRFSASGAFEAEWSAGLSGPQGIDDHPDGALVVADSGNDRVELFTAGGGPLGGWGLPGAGPGEFDLPRGVAVDCVARIYVSDAFNHRIQVFVDPERPEHARGCLPSLEQLIETVLALDLPGRSERAVARKLASAGDALERGDLRRGCRGLHRAAHQLERLTRRRAPEPAAEALRAIRDYAGAVGCEQNIRE